METREPRVALVRSGDKGQWTVELRGFKAIRERLGADVLNAFCRCFVHADRLTSMTSFAYLSPEHYGRDAIAFDRDLNTMVWFAVGTLRELARSICALRSALAKRGALDAEQPCWVKLQEVAKRWDKDPFFRKMRDMLAFHVDEKIIEDGLLMLEGKEEEGEVVLLCAGQGDKCTDSSFVLGLNAIDKGMGKNEAEQRRFAKMVCQDQGIEEAIDDAFFLALDAVGIPYDPEEA